MGTEDIADILRNIDFPTRRENMTPNPSMKVNSGRFFAGLCLIGLIQGPLIVNIQLLLNYSALFPYLDFSTLVADIMTTFWALSYQIRRRSDLCTFEWWMSVVFMLPGYAYFKYWGMYGDCTAYLIAEAKGTHLGGGAAMAHVPLGLYLCGPAQFLSWLGFHQAPFCVRSSGCSESTDESVSTEE